MLRSLSKRDERGLRQLIKLAKDEGLWSVTWHGVTFRLPRPAAGDQAAVRAQSRLPAQGAPGCAKAADRVATPPVQGRTASDAAGNSRQRRSFARQKLHKETQAAARSVSCRLRLRAILLRGFRWQRMQAVWTEWMRQRTPTAILPALENIEMTTDDYGTRKRVGCSISTPLSPSVSTEEAAGKKTRSGESPASPVPAAEAGAGPSHGATASPRRLLSHPPRGY
jgi:hypothetical protein